MRTKLNIVGAVLVLLGAILFLQGVKQLPGSFMTGQVQWAVHGVMSVVGGIAILLVANRRGMDGRR